MSLPYIVEPMTAADLEEVLCIERASFPRPWSVRAFLSELVLPYTCYLVVRPAAEEAVDVVSPLPPRWRWRLAVRVPRLARKHLERRAPIVGYAGLRVILSEGHVMNLAVHPDWRRQGIAELLLLRQFDEGRQRGALYLTLEVRTSNEAARNLYHKYGFYEAGHHRRYYGDGEDALMMRTGWLDTPESLAHLEELRTLLLRRLEVDPPAREHSGGDS